MGQLSLLRVNVIFLNVRVTCDVESMKMPNEESSEREETGFVTVLSSSNGVMRVF